MKQEPIQPRTPQKLHMLHYIHIRTIVFEKVMFSPGLLLQDGLCYKNHENQIEEKLE